MTGHNSDAVRSYKNTSDKLQREISGKLQNKAGSTSVTKPCTKSVAPNDESEENSGQNEVEIVEVKPGLSDPDNCENVTSKRKVSCLDVHKLGGTNTICQMIENMVQNTKYKRVKLSVELSDCD